jgi:DNA polymerase II large subunit
LRAKHKVFVSRDGTCRFDATDVPLTHFKPSEISVGIEKLKELCYDKDIYGKPLENEEQILALYPQDIILSRNGAKYLYQVACFIDDLIEKFYGLERFYNLKSPEDLVGHLAIGLSPHTSAGVLCRIIGFTDAHVGFGHPYFHCAKRRNTDGDEDSVILLMDGLLNFSYYFLPSSRGGTMDAPLVLSTTIDPEEIDDEVHAMEVCESYPAEFYELADKFSPPSEVNIENVKSRLGKPEQFFSLGYTHNVSNIAAGPHQTAYLKFKDMEEKIFAQMALQEKIRAVDSADAAERLLLHHFLPDLYGNLRSFSQQSFRCLDCKAKFRRVPLIGKCPECGGKLLQTIHKGGITKYLEYSAALIEKYNLPNYLKQRIELLRKDIDSVFAEEKEPQKGLAEFM